MAFQYNHYYEIYNYSSGKYVNLNGDHENDVVNNGEKVTCSKTLCIRRLFGA